MVEELHVGLVELGVVVSVDLVALNLTLDSLAVSKAPLVKGHEFVASFGEELAHVGVPGAVVPVAMHVENKGLGVLSELPLGLEPAVVELEGLVQQLRVDLEGKGVDLSPLLLIEGHVLALVLPVFEGAGLAAHVDELGVGAWPHYLLEDDLIEELALFLETLLDLADAHEVNKVVLLLLLDSKLASLYAHEVGQLLAHVVQVLDVEGSRNSVLIVVLLHLLSRVPRD
mmetsp:Transcript_11054/g.18486  ORF Transcript_11054/g.18486 Transcript_11054/m.18486 type:complete len:228 (+) Transcript_11054:578-1261(+)